MLLNVPRSYKNSNTGKKDVMNTAESTSADVEIVLDVDLDKEPQCASTWHGRPDADHPHSGPATFWLTVPCGHNGLRCTPLAVFLKAIPRVRCCHCNAVATIRECSFIEL